MKRVSLSMLLLGAAMLAGAQPTPGDPNSGRFVVAGDTAYSLLLPTQALADNVVQAAWSSDGNTVLMFRRDDRITDAMLQGLASGVAPANHRAEARISLWDRRADRLVDVWRGEVDPGSPAEIGMVGRSGYALVTLYSPNKILEVNLGQRSARILLESNPGDDRAAIYATATSRGRDVAALMVMAGSKGSLGRVIPYLPGRGFGKALETDRGMAFFSAEGPEIVAPASNFQSGHRYSVATNTWTRYEGRPRLHEEPEPGVFGPLRLEGGEPNNPLRIRATSAKAEGLALVAAEGETGQFSPSGDAVLFTVQGVAMVRPLSKVPYALYVQAREAAERTRLLSNAKQVGTALLILAADYDDMLPGSDGWQDRVYPYIKNRELMAGFVYTFRGGLLTDVQEPHKTELGYIPGPGGRAVVYADGHGKWIPDS